MVHKKMSNLDLNVGEGDIVSNLMNKGFGQIFKRSGSKVSFIPQKGKFVARRIPSWNRISLNSNSCKCPVNVNGTSTTG